MLYVLFLVSILNLKTLCMTTTLWPCTKSHTNFQSMESAMIHYGGSLYSFLHCLLTLEQRE
ncbi:hypothetical protein ACS0TY_031579 [Phlomoides rotata]